MIEITSLQNPKIKEIHLLKNRRRRDATAQFLIEGYREIRRAVDAKVAICSLFVCREFFLGENEGELMKAAEQSGAAIYFCSPSVFKKIAYRERPDGLLACAKKMALSLSDVPRVQNGLYVVAESIEKPGNLGTILRSADGVGATAVLVCDRCTDIYNPNTVRASVGTLFTRPVIETTSSEAYAFLKSRQARIIATMPCAKKLYTQIDMTQGAALILGSEQLGLSSFWREHADESACIPMQGVADSLNVAMAATLVLYEALRQMQRPPSNFLK